MDERAAQIVDVMANRRRVDIYDALAYSGPLSDKQIRAAVPDVRRTYQQHLDLMREHGIVDCDPQTGKWFAIPGVLRWSYSEDDTLAFRETVVLLEQVTASRRADQYQLWLESIEDGTAPIDWLDDAGGTDTSLYLTPDELKSLLRERQEVLERYRHRAADGRTRVVMQEYVFPFQRPGR